MCTILRVQWGKEDGLAARACRAYFQLEGMPSYDTRKLGPNGIFDFVSLPFDETAKISHLSKAVCSYASATQDGIQ